MAGAPIPFLDAEAVIRGTPFPHLMAALNHAFAVESHHAPPRRGAPIDSRMTLLVMPAWTAQRRIGVKLVTVDSEARPSVRSTYILYDPAGDRPLAMIDGAMLTRRRTAAASVLAATMLARGESRTLLLLGTGALAAPLIEAYAGAFALDRILIWGRDGAKAEQAAEAARAQGFPAQAIADRDAALGQADIVSSATLATAPLIRGELLRPGTHVDLIGAFRPDMCEADGQTFQRARVFVDTFEGALEEAGDLLQAIAGGFLTRAAIAGDLAALASGRHPGRDGDETAITLFKSVGTAIEDLVAAEMIHAAELGA